MIYGLFLRGKGLFKLLYVIDDFFRFIMFTILFPLFTKWLNLGKPWFILALVIGIFLDLLDFYNELGTGMQLSLNVFSFKSIFQSKGGFMKLIFGIQDLVQLMAMTILIPIFFRYLKLNTTFIFLGVFLGISIDVHDFMQEFSHDKIKINKEEEN